jgi:hypothetical protein
MIVGTLNEIFSHTELSKNFTVLLISEVYMLIKKFKNFQNYFHNVNQQAVYDYNRY